MKIIEGGICAPKDFLASGIRCGIKASAAKRDLALVFSSRPCTSAAVFTANLVQAASVTVSREHNQAGKIRALIANSGNANACTGPAGLEAARRMAQLTAEKLGIQAEETAVASTGVIGVPLPIEKVEAGIPELAASLNSLGADDALEAIMTTDTRKKCMAVEFSLPEPAVGCCGTESGQDLSRRGGERKTAFEAGGEASPLRIGAMVKGSGMIHPNMATMICVITTDAAVTAPMLDRALRRAVNRSFNRLTVDGDMSTNDMALIMANGAAGCCLIDSEGPAWEAFALALEEVCAGLARAMARDGEGATRLVTVTVDGAACEEDAAALARSVAGSSLVKAACFGADANWGRVLCALGYAGVAFEPEETSVTFASAAGDVPVCKNGGSLPFSEEKAKQVLLEEEIEIRVVAGKGPGRASAWGCDLSYDYVKINGDYRS
ncbi:MAG: bifunctional ornithine acetyltransferase/N-acetylglutamate synthase [Spirochaetaceae bacterium]|jgi:glutamate N-acetyltransferase/amino-acid N-acetyltransferase|nr:bifunctional ornithine acetyltransferase/N-acetylglutamate synthase [Spirochaetaceae bacterium]